MGRSLEARSTLVPRGEAFATWIEQVPSDWEIVQGKRLFQEIKDQNHPEEPLLSVTQDSGVIPRDESALRFWNPGDDVSGYKLVEPGDFVISLRSFEGGVEWSGVRGIVSPAYVVLRRRQPLVDAYFRYLLKSKPVISTLQAVSTGIRQGKNIGYLEFSQVPLPLPGAPVQRAIADFLDHRTAQIDALIEEKQRLIDLLEEKRTALITRAVTRGLEEQLGKWPVKRLRYSIRLNPSAKELKGVASDLEVTFVPMEAVGEKGGLDLTETRTLGEVGSNYSYFGNDDVLIAKITPCFENFKGSLARGLENGIGFGTTELHVARAGEEIEPKFLFYVTMSDRFRKLGAAEMKGAAGQQRVSGSFVQDFRQPIPERSEQVKTIEFLDRQTAKIDALIEELEASNLLLEEHRTALISAAVTGRIDVSDRAA